MPRLCCLLVCAAALMPSTASAAVPAADLVLRGGVIVTLDSARPQVQALAIKDGKILALGGDAAIARYIGPKTRVMDLDGAFATPGFIEGHGHFLELGESLRELNLAKARDWSEILAMVKTAAAHAKPGAWIVGHGWHQEKWTQAPQPNVEGLPLHASLDAVSPRNPVLLIHASGHAVFVNATALKLSGITDQTPAPQGGQIVRDARGRPIGMLRDNAMAPVYAAYRRYLAALPTAERKARRREAVRLAAQDAVSKGITTFVDMGENFRKVEFLKHEAAAGLPLRLYVLINDEPVAELDRHLEDYRIEGYAGDHFTVRGVGEILADGALGTHSAWFLKPYDDLPGSAGVNVTPMAEIRRIAEIAARERFQLAVHAIGDRANREVLDVYRGIFRQDPAAHALRWRIEHAQHLDPEDIPRFAQLGVIASMQAIHACSDGPYVVKRIGERRAREGAYAWRALLATGARIANGTDVPVEDENPVPNFYCAVTRRLKDGSYFFPEQRMRRIEALRSYTLDNAYAIFAERRLGSLAPGKLADIAVFSADLLTVPAGGIPRTRVLYTIVGGRLVYRRTADGRP